ncbi:hypothetical protein ACNAWD_03825 [Rhodococcus erythropolis]|nr:hypothetical protein [Rhodococcus erythropolis]EEN89021.1 hypothetical protein RHOER0001_1507 [Rhodococcus erythropolis SK121]MCW0194742.1 hypothetical protein [Rhodococcus sp. (in: high G+C Gram-positive bacteria)]MCW2298986.1 hypothetical protein [Rhodococcus erythropolis]
MSVEFLRALKALVTGLTPVLGGSLDGLNAMSMNSNSDGGL